MSDLNLDHDEARALHRIVRAMHDGECPRCHIVSPAEAMAKYRFLPDGTKRLTGWECSECYFSISKEEADEVFAIFAPFMDRNLEIFEQWRASRKTVTTE